MMSQNNSSELIDLNILGRKYVISVGDQDYERLLSAINLLNEQVQEVSSAMPDASSEKVSVMVALNMVYHLLTYLDEMCARVQKINKNCADIISWHQP